MGTRVITYDTAGDVVTDYTSPADDPSTPEEFAEKALHHAQASSVKVWLPGRDPETTPPDVDRTTGV